jgi:lipid II:glycine glycyltransferase (peptidoglycan interpeptide bridge formation enzyme)
MSDLSHQSSVLRPPPSVDAPPSSVVSPPSSVTTEVDQVTEEEWSALLGQFADATIYQTWPYGAVRWGAQNLSHAVLLQGNDVRAAAQVRIAKLPGVRAGIAYVAWGPLWQRKNETPEPSVLGSFLRVLRQEYAERHGLALRVRPNVFDEPQSSIRTVLEQEGFTFCPLRNRTILIDLSPPLKDLRSGFRRRWRQTLDKAETAGIETVLGTDIRLYDEALRIYEEMHDRKGFTEFVNVAQFRDMQARLPAEHKMQILLCRLEGAPIAALAWATVGDAGLPLLAATGRKALENDAAYLMWWKMLEWLKLNGFRCCDVGGINAERNPGSYIFKTGMAKKHGSEMDLLGDFECCKNPFSSLLLAAGKRAKQLRASLKLTAEKLRRDKPAPAGGKPLAPGQPVAAEAPTPPDRIPEATSSK